MHDGGILKRKKKPTAPSALTWTNQHAQHDGAPRLFCFIKRWKAGPYTQLFAVSSKNSSTQAVYGYICQLHRERQISFKFSPVATDLRLICHGREVCWLFNRSLCLYACSHLRTQSSGHKRMHGFILLFPFTYQYLLQNALNYGTRERRDGAENPTRRKENKIRNIDDFKQVTVCMVECSLTPVLMASCAAVPSHTRSGS